ncbi:hypothetical protein [Pseudoalteromonas luteoviolacea]|uniref:Lipoprotein n=1 Tax=Pseudoalteromonas luteoviolacea H33 TaxID=1365251 RepID=A0A167E261_9GAMM|nr:hypothetical protein [Pseudoalteromonas luteoviolacea]KZN49908.1 hypothetical protein N476_18045 [Pseudoalteromonas luteoviolacea H33]KZN74822.1 hypothetical protein N477_21460 [Pseudoalteromonas luteoviolacea H33-S]
MRFLFLLFLIVSNYSLACSVKAQGQGPKAFAEYESDESYKNLYQFQLFIPSVFEGAGLASVQIYAENVFYLEVASIASALYPRYHVISAPMNSLLLEKAKVIAQYRTKVEGGIAMCGPIWVFEIPDLLDAPRPERAPPPPIGKRN